MDALQKNDQERKKVHNVKNFNKSLQDIDDTFDALDDLEKRIVRVKALVTSTDGESKTKRPKGQQSAKVNKNEPSKTGKRYQRFGLLKSMGKVQPIKMQDQ